MTSDEQKIRLGLADIEGIAQTVRQHLGSLVATSSVTLSKAAETDRLTDENRALRQKVEDLEDVYETLRKTLDAACAERNKAQEEAEALRGDLKLVRKQLFDMDAERVRMVAEIDRAKEWHAHAFGPDAKWIGTVAVDVPAPDYVTRAELIEALTVAANLVGGPSHYSLRALADALVKP